MYINEKKMAIEMTKKFYTESCKYGTDEYKTLQEVRRDYPGYKPVVAKTKKNGMGTLDAFKGLTYEYMEIYIEKHDDEENHNVTAACRDAFRIPSDRLRRRGYRDFR